MSVGLNPIDLEPVIGCYTTLRGEYSLFCHTIGGRNDFSVVIFPLPPQDEVVSLFGSVLAVILEMRRPGMDIESMNFMQVHTSYSEGYGEEGLRINLGLRSLGLFDRAFSKFCTLFLAEVDINSED